MYLLHPEYAKMGQHALNQRSFYEWIGEVNTFTKPVPCYSSGIKRFRKGINSIYGITFAANMDHVPQTITDN